MPIIGLVQPVDCLVSLPSIFVRLGDPVRAPLTVERDGILEVAVRCRLVSCRKRGFRESLQPTGTQRLAIYTAARASLRCCAM